LCFLEAAMMRYLLLALVPLLWAGPVQSQEAVDYTRDIKPLLKERCVSCHGALKQRSGLRLDTAALMKQGGDTGPAIMPGKASPSLLIQRITNPDPKRRMPPPGEAEPLDAKQIAVVRRWIEQGAMAPATEKAEEDPRNHWAFRKPVRASPPSVKNSDWAHHPVDAFVAAAHEKHGLTPQPLAAKNVLLRRVYLDLIGLPPSRDALHAFLQDSSPDAYEKVVDRLLSSPQYGERWARHWMDVWRYSDWYGRRGVPDVWNSAPQIWRWRDWIIRSLNADKGYDRMIMEMLAGDEVAPEDDEAGYATGYLVRNWYALNPNQWMRDNVEHTGKAFLGLTLNCAHCHDHKYDPISQEEYFRFRAFFEPLGLRQDRVPGEPDPGPFQRYDYSVLRKVQKFGAVRVYDEKPDAKTWFYAGGDERNRIKDRPAVTPAALAFLGGSKLAITPVDLPATAYYPGVKPFVRQEEIARREQAVTVVRTELEKAKSALAAAKSPEGTADGAALENVIRLREAKLATAEADLKAFQARIAADDVKHKKPIGNFEELARAASKAERLFALCKAKENLLQGQQTLESARKTSEAKAASKEKDVALVALKKAEQQLPALKKAVEQAEQALTVMNTNYTPLSPTYPARSTGRRKALAEWIASRDNPLTARVAVNHIWLRHFDQPLVDTVFDFGRNGKRPSHPELLDWLAVELMESGWKMKHLHRLIVTSRTYRLASTTPAEDHPNLAKDADNRLLWRANPKRMEAEMVRDTILYTSGELDAAVGGPVLENTEAPTSRRRSLYFSVYPEGGGHAKFLEIFDAPDTCDCYRRSASVLPQQALALTNDQFTLKHSRLLARKLQTSLATKNADGKVPEEGFLTAAFEQILGRPPTADERSLCNDFLRRQQEVFRKAAPVPAVNGSVAPSADPVLRARESLVRVLFNHGDFVTVR
jgi:mono/diheme cytochrome c family protein